MAFTAISSSLVFSSVKRAVCDDHSAISPTNRIEWATFLASSICQHVHKPNFSTLIARTRFESGSVVQPYISHHTRVSQTCRRASRSFQMQPIVDLFHLQTHSSSALHVLCAGTSTSASRCCSSAFCTPQPHAFQRSLNNLSLRRETPSTYIPRDPHVYVGPSSTSLY